MKQRNGHPDLIESQLLAPVYELRGVSKIYGAGESRIAALENIDLTIGPGEFVAVVGASGSGKTTMLQLLGALDRPTNGTIACTGRPLAEMSERELTLLRRTRIGFVFQQFNLVPTLTARQNIEAKLAVAESDVTPGLAESLLDSVGLGGRAIICPRSSLAATSNMSRSLARWLPTQASFWPTSRPATSTRKRARQSSGCCELSPPSTVRPSF